VDDTTIKVVTVTYTLFYSTTKSIFRLS